MPLAESIIKANSRTNLIGSEDTPNIVARHILDSLAALRLSRLHDQVVDVGAGAGFPGLVAALAFPGRRFRLLEPRAKRFEFLTTVVTTLKTPNVEVHKLSAQAAQERWPAAAGTVLMRAVAPPAHCFALALPLLRSGGELLMYIGKQAGPTQSELLELRKLGGKLATMAEIVVPFLQAKRHAWLVVKR